MEGNPKRPVVVRCPFCERQNRVDLARLDLGPKCGGCGRPLRLDRPLKATAADFDRTIETASVPVVVDFYADWCGPFRAMAPALDQFAAARMGQVLVLKVDTDANPGLSRRFDIRGIPTLVAFAAGRESGRHVGMAGLADLDRLAAAAQAGVSAE